MRRCVLIFIKNYFLSLGEYFPFSSSWLAYPSSKPSSLQSLQPTSQPSSQPSSRPTQAQSTTFTYTGAVQAYHVPAGVATVTVTAAGAQGGQAGSGTTIRTSGAGLGGRIVATVAVTPQTSLFVYVGGAGKSGPMYTNKGGFNGGGNASYYTGASPYYWGGGGGGASDVRSDLISLPSRVVVAGGGGGEMHFSKLKPTVQFIMCLFPYRHTTFLVSTCRRR